jgi:hypothetical protein
MRRTVLLAGAAMASIGLAAFGLVSVIETSNLEHWDGVVTQLQPLCVGRYAATGDCFNASPAVVSHLYAGECVEVTFAPHDDGAVRQNLRSIRKIAASADRRDCPTGKSP